MRLCATGLAGIILGTSLLAGCATSDQVYYYQRSVLGIDASASTVDASGSVIVGYRRKFAVYVPPVAEDGEAMPVISCVDIQAGTGVASLTEFSVSEAMATGDAATNYAEQLAEGASSPFRCFALTQDGG